MPPASSGHGAQDPLGWSTSRPPTTMAHTGPNQLLPWPWHPCYSQARPILSLTMTESTKKRSRATDLRCPPAAVGRGHRVMLGACGQPTAQATQTCHRRTRQRRGLAPPRVRHSSGASWLAGGSEDGKRNGEEKTTHNLRDTHWAFLPGGPFSTVRPSVECGVGSRSRQRCSYTTLLLGTPPGPALGMWPAPAQGLGLQVFLSLLYMSHHIGSLSSRLDCPSCEEDLAGGPQGAPSLS